MRVVIEHDDGDVDLVLIPESEIDHQVIEKLRDQSFIFYGDVCKSEIDCLVLKIENWEDKG
jgi:hypothetical protein